MLPFLSRPAKETRRGGFDSWMLRAQIAPLETFWFGIYINPRMSHSVCSQMHWLDKWLDAIYSYSSTLFSLSHLFVFARRVKMRKLYLTWHPHDLTQKKMVQIKQLKRWKNESLYVTPDCSINPRGRSSFKSLAFLFCGASKFSPNHWADISAFRNQKLIYLLSQIVNQPVITVIFFLWHEKTHQITKICAHTCTRGGARDDTLVCASLKQTDTNTDLFKSQLRTLACLLNNRKTVTLVSHRIWNKPGHYFVNAEYVEPFKHFSFCLNI